MFNIRKWFSTSKTPQSEPIPGSTQVPNSAGGYSFEVNDWMRLDRFLILGTEGGSYYATEQKLTRESAEAVLRCIQVDGSRAVACIARISKEGRAPKNDPAIFALAMAAKLGDEATRKAAGQALPEVCRTGTHLMHFAEFAEGFGGWGRGLRGAVGRWYNDKPASELAYQLVKYQSRDGWSNRDLLRLAHPKAKTPDHQALFAWATRGSLPAEVPSALAIIEAVERAKKATTVNEIVALIRTHDLPRECVPTQLLTHAPVWEALLERMPFTALIRNLATMTRVGLLAPMAPATAEVVRRLEDEAGLIKARVHPVQVLAALMTYKSGKGVRGNGTWSPASAVVDALDAAFYKAFRAVEPSNTKTLLALDVSGSMSGGTVAGVPGLTPRVASAAMALVTAATEKQHGFVAFTNGLTELDISPRQRLDDICARTAAMPFGGTDCALPMLWAKERKLEVETFIVYTDSETWAGKIHPVQALADYRRESGIPAKLIVVGLVANKFSIADPKDAGMLDVVGFDTASPALIADFARLRPNKGRQDKNQKGHPYRGEV